ncbi:MAG TPA: MFS transporter [Micropruina sp.]|nr:MFS transporter [Micropruina sp.]
MKSLRGNWPLAITLYLLGIFMGAIDTGIVTPARTVIATDLGVGEQLSVWLITVYTLAYAAAIPVMGKLADRLGRKPVYLTAIALFGLGSLLCGLSQDAGSFGMLVVARVIQAIGGGGILPIATAEIGTQVPPQRRGMALGLVGAVFGIANLLGASAGSLILSVAGTHNWQWIFYINVPIAIGIVALGLVVLPDHRRANVAPMDLIGTALLVGIIMCLLYGLTNLDFFDVVTSVRSVGVYPWLVAVAVLIPLFILAERRAADPVLNLGYFTDRSVALTLLLSLLSGFVLMGVVFVPQLAENALKLPSGSGGYLVIILGLASGIGAPLSGRLTDAFGPKRVLGTGAAISALAAVSAIAWLLPTLSLASVIVTLVLIGLGLGFIIGSPLNYLMLRLTPAKESASALGTLSLVRSIGTTLAPVIMVGFLAHAGLALQDRLTADLPTTITAPELPYAATLQKRFADWKADDRFADALKGVEFPDLTAQSTISVSADGDGTLPDDLVTLLKNADVTTIVAATKTVADRMYDNQTPSVIADIQGGVETGVTQLGTVDAKLAKTQATMTKSILKMSKGIAGMSKGIAKMDRALASMGTTITRMSSGIRGMTSGLDGMTTGITKMTAARASMTRGITGMDKGLTGLDAAIAGVSQPIAGLDAAIDGIDRGLAEQRAALSHLQAAGDPALQPQIEALQKSIAALEQQRAERVAERTPLLAKRAALSGQRSKLADQRADLAAARTALSSQRTTLIAKRADLRTQRAELVTARAKLIGARDKLLAARITLTRKRSELTHARSSLVAARAEITDARSEIAETTRQLKVLNAAVPAAFQQARADYLAEIDARGPQLQATYQTTLNEGFRDLYLLYGAACLLMLGILPFIQVPALEAGSRPDQPGADPGGEPDPAE